MSAYLLDKENNVCSTELLMDRVNILEKAYINLEVKITRLFEEVRDIRELRYQNHQQIGCVEAKVNELERDSKIYSNPLQQQVWQENIVKRLEKLERLVEFCHFQKPHKCPVCEGKSKPFKYPQLSAERNDCRVCDSQGIVWG